MRSSTVPSHTSLWTMTVLALADAPRPVGGLVLDGRVPPPVVVDHLAGAAVRLSPVPPAFSDTSSSGGPCPAWNVGDHAVAARSAPRRRGGTAPSQLEALGEVAHEQLAHLPELGEHERPLVDVEQLVDELVEAGQLAGAPGEAASRRRATWAGWLQICLSRVSAASTRPRRFIPVVVGGVGEQLVDDVLVEHRLLAGEAGPGDLLDLVGQVGHERPVGLGAAQHERLRQRAAARGRAASPSPSRSIGLAKRWRKRSRLPSMPGLTASRIDHSSASRFSTGVPVRASFCAGAQPADRLGRLGGGVLHRPAPRRHDRAPSRRRPACSMSRVSSP